MLTLALLAATELRRDPYACARDANAGASEEDVMQAFCMSRSTRAYQGNHAIKLPRDREMRDERSYQSWAGSKG